jgi:HlyD family secretion protein
MKKTLKIAILALLMLVIVLGSESCRSGRGAKTMIVDGTIECDEINVSSKVPGRIDKLFVDEGDTVKPGEPLVILESKEIDAKVAQTAASFESSQSRVNLAGTSLKLQQLTYVDQLNQAQAQYNARREDIHQAEENLNQAKANYKTQSDTYKRFHGLYADGVVPEQVEQDHEYAYLAAKAQLGAAESKLEQARHSLKAAEAALQLARDANLQVNIRQEEQASATQQSAAAHGQLEEALALQSETKIVAPVTGYVSEKISNAGEMVSPGFPMLTVVRANDFKVKVYVDESKFGHLRLGNKIKVILPAFGNEEVYGTLMRISQAADFATKRATNEQGSFDVRGLQLVIKLEDNPRYRNGMTARVQLDEGEK